MHGRLHQQWEGVFSTSKKASQSKKSKERQKGGMGGQIVMAHVMEQREGVGAEVSPKASPYATERKRRTPRNKENRQKGKLNQNPSKHGGTHRPLRKPKDLRGTTAEGKKGGLRRSTESQRKASRPMSSKKREGSERPGPGKKWTMNEGKVEGPAQNQGDEQ